MRVTEIESATREIEDESHVYEMMDLVAAAEQEEQEVQVRKERALQARVKWKEGREKRELVRSLLREIISESVNSSVKCFDMKPVKLEIDRIKRVFRDHEDEKNVRGQYSQYRQF